MILTQRNNDGGGKKREKKGAENVGEVPGRGGLPTGSGRGEVRKSARASVVETSRDKEGTVGRRAEPGGARL